MLLGIYTAISRLAESGWLPQRRFSYPRVVILLIMRVSVSFYVSVVNICMRHLIVVRLTAAGRPYTDAAWFTLATDSQTIALLVGSWIGEMADYITMCCGNLNVLPKLNNLIISPVTCIFIVLLWYLHMGLAFVSASHKATGEVWQWTWECWSKIQLNLFIKL